MSEIVLQTTDLSFSYPNSTRLTFEDMKIQQQQHTLILGESGSGKSTLLHLIGGFSLPATGTVTIQGQNIYDLRESKLDQFRAQHLGFIFQEAHLLKNLSVIDNIKLAQSLAGFSTDTQAIQQLLGKLQLSNLGNRKPNELSRGQVQRVAIARALINKPAILLADEPTASLDDKNTFLVIELLKCLANEQGSTLLISTHDKRLKDEFSNNYLLSAQ
ncbi:ABC transporter ATP-binding protein [Sphingobacterium lactis]|uniref:ABC transporter ATP-binding protein n=1 Tax=Sphingobacterium lactis TaxID=797291 RepID=UPI003F7D1902